jgi:hypothetical protein
MSPLEDIRGIDGADDYGEDDEGSDEEGNGGEPTGGDSGKGPAAAPGRPEVHEVTAEMP